uniref:Transmembrane protein n=1 Tax=Peronospora matthiolae TaxID=2874970 RepID=A0AAV1V9L7_9STRA
MAHELVSPHCSSWSFSNSFNLCGTEPSSSHEKFDTASTVTASPVHAESYTGRLGFYEAALSPMPTVPEHEIGHRFRRTMALLVNYFAAGLFHGIVPALVYPLFKIRLGLQSYQANAVQTLLHCAWHSKVLLCLLTDCVPICGRRRTPYLYIGWTLVLAIFGFVIILYPSLFTDAGAVESPALVLVISAASVGYLLVDASCDGIMVETVQLDNQCEERGRRNTSNFLQTAVHAVRFVAELFGTLLIAVGMNSEAYGGRFPFELSLRALFKILIAIAMIALGATAWGLRESRSEIGYAIGTDTLGAPMPGLRAKLGEFWSIMHQQATWHIACLGFLQKMCLSFGMDSAPLSQAIHEFWLHTDPFMKNLFLALANGGVCVAASLFVHRCLLYSSWHSSLLIALLGGLVVSIPTIMVVVFDVWRSKVFFLIATAVTGFSDCIAMVVRMLVVVEIAEPGLESSTYGLVTSVYNLADPVATAMSNAIGARFQAFDMDMKQDSHDVRVRVGVLFTVLFSVRALVGLGTLRLLPRHKQDARELKARGGSSRQMTLAVFLAIGIAFLAAFTANLLSVFSSTSCLRVAGGAGC